MTDWKDILDEKVSKKHKAQVMHATANLLAENKKAAGEERRWFFSKAWGLGLAGAAAIAGVVYVQKQNEGITSEDAQALALAPEITEGEDLDLFADLEILEDLEDLEKWEDS